MVAATFTLQLWFTLEGVGQDLPATCLSMGASRCRSIQLDCGCALSIVAVR